MKTVVKTVTPEMAKNFLLKNTLNRKLNDKTVLFYAKQMQEGEWKLNGEGLSFASDGSILNGQHRLSAVVKSGCNIDFLISFDVEKDAMPTFDTGKNRSLCNVFQIANIPDANNMSAIIQNYVSFVKLGSAGERTPSKELRFTKKDFLSIHEQNPEFWHKISLLSQNCYNKIRLLMRSKIGGFSAYLILEKGKNEDLVYDFMLQLFTIKSDQQPATKIYREILIKDSFSLKKISLQNKIAMLIKTWNYFEEKRNIKIINFNPNIEKYPEIAL
jgi:hypothetical protein